MNNINSLLNQQHQFSSLEEIHNHQYPNQMPSSSSSSSHDDFLEQMLASVPSSAGASFPWTDEHLEEQSTTEALLASKMRQHQISNGAAKANLMLQQQLMLSNIGLLSMPRDGRNDVVDGSSFQVPNLVNDASVKALFNGFTGSLGQISNQNQHFNRSQSQNFGGVAATPAMNQPAASGSSGGGTAAQPRRRARRGQATDPHSIAERLRRERIAERMKSLQELLPNANKTDKASMLDEIIDYLKFLQLQVKVLSMSRLGGARAAAPLVADTSLEVGKVNGTLTASSSNYNDGLTVTENQVSKLMEEDMGSAMQYLQGKGLCLMPISLASAISTATCHNGNPLAPSNNPLLLNGEAGCPTSPSISALTGQSATIFSVKDANSV